MSESRGAQAHEEHGVYVGIDVSKAWLDVATSSGERWQIANKEAGRREMLTQLAARAPRLVVLEATGGYEAPIAAE